MDSDTSPSARHAPPHIRLNSGSDDLLGLQQRDDNSYALRPTSQRQPSSRSLTSPQQSSRPGTAPGLHSQPSANSLYNSQAPAESAEQLLLPPRRGRTRRFRDDESPMRSPDASGFNSRRTSWSSGSAGSRDSRYGGPFASPFDDSRAPSRAGSDEDGVNTQTVSEKYNILPSAGLLLFPEDVEKDDYLHNPDPNDRDRMVWRELFSKRGLLNVGGLLLITLGVLILFIGYPILTFAQRYANPGGSTCSHDPMCLSDSKSLLKNVRHGLIDPDTPNSEKTRKGENGKILSLVFSDEFNDDGRTFYDSDDPFYQGVDIWYGVTNDLEWYDPDALTTKDGTLNIRFDAFPNHNLNYRSGMLQSWNKLCFKGGLLETSISLPGRGDTVGFWPGFWAMGNLGRPGYAATTDGMWPYSYWDECDAGITNNQSDPSGLSYLPGMRLPACTCLSEDHPNAGKSRSAPEIDVIEASVDHLTDPAMDAVGSASQSLQVAPYDVMWRPNADFIEVYDTHVTRSNSYQGGVYQQALSGVTLLNNDWYDGNAYQSYSFEYTPGANGHVTWKVGSDKTWKVLGESIGPNGNIGQRVVPEEPMSIIANFGLSNNFATLNMSGLGPLMPATMRLDYIRIYQDETGEMTCDPVGYPTTDYIAQHPLPYNNPNYTLWEDTGYGWPQNSYQHDCTSETKRDESFVERKARLAKRSWWPFSKSD